MPQGLTEPPVHKRLTGPEAVRVGAMTALRLDHSVGTGHPRPCRRAPGRSKALGGGAALASSVRVWAVLNTLLRDFTETRHGKDPGLVRWEPRIQEAGSSSRAFSCADSHGGGGGGVPAPPRASGPLLQVPGVVSGPKTGILHLWGLR